MKFYRRFFDSDPRLARFGEIRRDEVVSEPTTYLPRVWQPDLSQPACSKNHPCTKAAEEHPLVIHARRICPDLRHDPDAVRTAARSLLTGSSAQSLIPGSSEQFLSYLYLVNLSCCQNLPGDFF